MAGYARVLSVFILLKVSQKLNQTVLLEGNGKYEIQYLLHDKVYKIKTRKKRGPKRIVRVEDEQGNDITEKFFSYLGPNHDFHGTPMSPRELCHEVVHIYYRNGDMKKVEGDSKIHAE